MKKLICIVMSVTIALMCVMPSFTVSAVKDEKPDPIIVVSGVGACPFYMDEGTENERIAFPPKVDVGKIILKVLFGVFKAFLKNDFDVFAEAVGDAVYDVLGEFACDENGNSKYNVTPQRFPKSQANYDMYKTTDSAEYGLIHSLVDKFGGDNVYFYNYDWRLDPLSNADELQAFIKNVLKETGDNKVDLIPCS
ncbi:MAG: hypothetical protein K6F09_04070, partial [Clostridiales bacterium]|nr:hypothetical protein [Clostridiales bacterium]